MFSLGTHQGKNSFGGAFVGADEMYVSLGGSKTLEVRLVCHDGTNANY